MKLIDRDKAQAVLVNMAQHLLEAGNTEMAGAVGYAAEVVGKQCVVDAVEVVHGHWCWEGQFKACSRCGSYVEMNETLGASFWKFCPYCGTRMDGVAE